MGKRVQQKRYISGMRSRMLELRNFTARTCLRTSLTQMQVYSTDAAESKIS